MSCISSSVITRRRFLLGLAAWPLAGLASPLPVAPTAGFQRWGSGEFRHFGFLVYEATLWAGGDDPLRPPLAPDDTIMSLQLPPEMLTVRVPTLVITGSQDKTVRPENQARLVQGIAGAHQLILNGGHAIMVEQPQAFNAALLQFLSDSHPAPL